MVAVKTTKPKKAAPQRGYIWEYINPWEYATVTATIVVIVTILTFTIVTVKRHEGPCLPEPQFCWLRTEEQILTNLHGMIRINRAQLVELHTIIITNTRNEKQTGSIGQTWERRIVVARGNVTVTKKGNFEHLDESKLFNQDLGTGTNLWFVALVCLIWCFVATKACMSCTGSASYRRQQEIVVRQQELREEHIRV